MCTYYMCAECDIHLYIYIYIFVAYYEYICIYILMQFIRGLNFDYIYHKLGTCIYIVNIYTYINYIYINIYKYI